MQLLHSGIEFLSIVQSQHFPKYSSQANDKKETEANMAYFNSTAATSSNLFERSLATVAQFLSNSAQRHAERRMFRETVTELSALSNRELADLGISRSEIGRIAWEAAHGSVAARNT